MPTLLALDLSSHTGWAVFVDGRLTEYGLKHFPILNPAFPAQRFEEFWEWITRLIEVYKPTDIVVERPHLRGFPVTVFLVGLYSRVAEAAARSWISFGDLHSASIKLAMTGNGRAEKAEVIAAVNAKYGLAITDDNEADAIATAYTAMTVPAKVNRLKVKVKKARVARKPRKAKSAKGVK
jgi:Holliday junction resolvasome RuvABC endonuclease subunit